MKKTNKWLGLKIFAGTLVALTPLSALVACSNNATVLNVEGGSLSLEGTVGIAGSDDSTKVWKLDGKTEGIVFSIARDESSLDFGNKITLVNNVVNWKDNLDAGQYKFKVDATKDDRIYSSKLITLTIKFSEIPIWIGNSEKFPMQALTDTDGNITVPIAPWKSNQWRIIKAGRALTVSQWSICKDDDEHPATNAALGLIGSGAQAVSYLSIANGVVSVSEISQATYATLEANRKSLIESGEDGSFWIKAVADGDNYYYKVTLEKISNRIKVTWNTQDVEFKLPYTVDVTEKGEATLTFKAFNKELSFNLSDASLVKSVIQVQYPSDSIYYWLKNHNVLSETSSAGSLKYSVAEGRKIKLSIAGYENFKTLTEAKGTMTPYYVKDGVIYNVSCPFTDNQLSLSVEEEKVAPYIEFKKWPEGNIGEVEAETEWYFYEPQILLWKTQTISSDITGDKKCEYSFYYGYDSVKTGDLSVESYTSRLIWKVPKTPGDYIIRCVVVYWYSYGCNLKPYIAEKTFRATVV